MRYSYGAGGEQVTVETRAVPNETVSLDIVRPGGGGGGDDFSVITSQPGGRTYNDPQPAGHPHPEGGNYFWQYYDGEMFPQIWRLSDRGSPYSWGRVYPR